MITQVENKVKEIKALKRKEYYKQKDTDLQNWGIAKEGKGKKATPIVITDEEYENLIKLSNGVGKTGRNTVAIALNKASVFTLVICALIAIVSLISGANVGFIACSVAGFGFALTFKGLSEAVRLLQQILDGGKGGIPEATPEENAAPVAAAAPQTPPVPPAFIATPNGYIPVQPPIYPAGYPAPYYSPVPQAAPVEAPAIVTAGDAKPTDYSAMPNFNFNPQEDFFGKAYEPKATFGENN